LEAIALLACELNFEPNEIMVDTSLTLAWNLFYFDSFLLAYSQSEILLFFLPYLLKDFSGTFRILTPIKIIPS